MGGHRQDALAAQGKQGDNLIVVSGIDIQIVAAQRCDLGYLADVAAGFLDGVDFGMRGFLNPPSVFALDTVSAQRLSEDTN